jgi:hypothetical protein
MEETADVRIAYNSYYDVVFVKGRALIGLEAVSKSYSCIEKLTF